MSSTSPVKLWSRNDIRHRIGSLIVLGVLAGLIVGITVAALDGAQRTGTALARLRARTNASDAVLFASQTEFTGHPDWDKLAKRPEVKALARWGLVFGNAGGSPDGVLFAAIDDVWLNTVDRPIVVAGRMFDPSAPDEIIVSDMPGADAPILHVGDVVPFTSLAADQDFKTPPRGPTVNFTVVGVVHTPLSNTFAGDAMVSPGYVAKFRGQALVAENAMVQLRNGAADMPALRRDASTDVIPGIPVLDLRVTGRRVTATTDVERAMLLLLATIIALAGVIFVGQALARSAATIGGDASSLGALGMTRRQLVGAAVGPHVVTAAVAATVTAVTAAVASRWFPVGLAAHVDPDRGVQIDITLLIIGIVAVITFVAVTAGLAGWFAAAQGERGRRRRGLLAGRGFGRPLTIGLGVRMAFDQQGRSATRSAFIGAAAAVAGLVAIITLNHGLGYSLTHPEVAGVAWDATVVPHSEDLSNTSGVSLTVFDAVAQEPGVAAVGAIGRVVSQIGDVGVPTFTVFDPPSGDHLQLVTLKGRAPERDDEMVLGPSTARDLHARIGSTLTLADGSPATVVGIGLFPSDVHQQFDEGVWLPTSRWLAIDAHADAALTDTAIAVRFTDRNRIDEQISALGSSLGDTVDGVGAAEQPTEFSNLRNVQRLPTLLASVLSILGAAAVGHALFSMVRRRRHDFAVLGALGITRAGSRMILVGYGTVVALVGLVVGVPIGIVAGRAGWRAITDRVPLTFRSPAATVAIILIVPLVLLTANVLAIIPGRRASRVDPALVLRTE